MLSLIRSTAGRLVAWMTQHVNGFVKAICRPAQEHTRTGAVLDLTRRKTDLVAENALLRHQLVLLKRSSKRPTLIPADRLSLLLLAKVTRTWRQVLLLVQPATVLRWHREGFRLFWRLKSRSSHRKPRITPDLVTLIHKMADENLLWGAERIRGERLKLGFKVAKRTIQRHIHQPSTPRVASQTWSTFLKTHVKDLCACDFVPVIDLVFQQLYVFFIIELHSRRVVHFNVTRHPTQFWIAQQLRESTPEGHKPKYIIRDNDGKFGSAFDAMTTQSGIEVLRTPIKAPKANGVCERFIGSVRRECLDHLLIFGERQLYRVIEAYTDYFNHTRPHQGIDQRVPSPKSFNISQAIPGKIISMPVLNGLHHEYRRAA